jgi:2-oxoisovalerate dehydrogenase E2 component (dihydrolipoyl transacylase)
MDFALPPVGEGLVEVELVRWLVQPGDAIVRGQSLAEVMSDKATMEVPSPFVGQIQELLAEPGVKVKVGQTFLRYANNGEPVEAVIKTAPISATPVSVKADPVAPVPQPPKPTPVATADKPLPAASPSVRQMARKLGIDLTRLRGTGPSGRILVEDLTAHLNKITRKVEASSRVPELPQQVGVAGTRQKMLGLRRKIADHMVASKRAIPHYAYIDECDVTDLVRLRSQLKETFGKAGVKLTYLPFIVKAAARALKEVPIVNATFDDAQQEIVLHDRYNIGIAVAGPSRPRPARCRPKRCCRDFHRDRSAERRCPGWSAQVGRSPRRNIHHHFHRKHRRAHIHADHQQPRGGYSRHRQSGSPTNI